MGSEMCIRDSATLFQGVGVEAPRAATLRRRAAEAPLVVSRQALAGAERSARAAHHVESLESLLVAAQRRRRLDYKCSALM